MPLTLAPEAPPLTLLPDGTPARPPGDTDDGPRPPRARSAGRPRGSGRRRKPRGNRTAWVVGAAFGAALLLGVGAFAVALTFMWNKPAPGGANPGPPAAAGGADLAAADPGPGKKQYVPRVSEEAFRSLTRCRDAEGMREAEVYAVMGEPTERASPARGVKNGLPYVVQDVFWEVPGAGVWSMASFVDGRLRLLYLGVDGRRP